jgi:hypothetical protein
LIDNGEFDWQSDEKKERECGWIFHWDFCSFFPFTFL